MMIIAAQAGALGAAIMLAPIGMLLMVTGATINGVIDIKRNPRLWWSDNREMIWLLLTGIAILSPIIIMGIWLSTGPYG